MAVGETIGTFFVLTLAYFWAYYKIIIKKKINSEGGKANPWMERVLHLAYFVLIIVHQKSVYDFSLLMILICV